MVPVRFEWGVRMDYLVLQIILRYRKFYLIHLKCLFIRKYAVAFASDATIKKSHKSGRLARQSRLDDRQIQVDGVDSRL
jgi:hypothetical protein